MLSDDITHARVSALLALLKYVCDLGIKSEDYPSGKIITFMLLTVDVPQLTICSFAPLSQEGNTSTVYTGIL